MDPLTLRLFKTFGPYVLVAVISASAGFSAAWYIQGLRLTEEKQRYKDREQAIIDQKQIEKDRTDKLNEETSNDWIKNLDALHQCYKSGRCGVRSGSGGMPSGGLSAPSVKPDATGTNSVPAPERVAEECAYTTLQINSLQTWIERTANGRTN
jgi:hypothetical protein